MGSIKQSESVIQHAEAEASPRLRPLRLCIVLGAFALVVFVLWWLTSFGLGSMPTQCILNRFTGLYCPGCGMTRATFAVLKFNFFAAFAYNPLGVVLFPLVMLSIGLEAIGWVRGVAPPWRISLGRYGAMVIAVVVILFFLFRNLPWYPFNWLAP